MIENEGPAAIILIRQSLARCTIPLEECLNLAIAVEQPFSDIILPTDDAGLAIGRRIQDLPDLTSHLNYHNDYGHLQLAGVVRRITYQSPNQIDARATGYGINFTGDCHLLALLTGEPTPGTDCASARAKSRFIWQYAAGYGIGRYVEDTTGLGLDAALGSTGELDALFSRGWYAGYEHWWTRRLTSTLVFSGQREFVDGHAGWRYLRRCFVPGDELDLALCRQSLGRHRVSVGRTPQSE